MNETVIDTTALQDPEPPAALSEWVPDFIIDDPAGVDALKSHAPLARAMAGVVRRGKARLIGLLGDWGSGKSTIMRLLETELAKSSPPVLWFPFDAWRHQSDPQRRAFLENLITLVEKRLDPPSEEDKPTKRQRRPKAADPSSITSQIESWRLEIERLNRAREKSKIEAETGLNGWAAAFGVSVLFLPLSLKLIGDGSLSPEDAKDLAAACLFWAGWVGTVLPVAIALLYVLRHKKDLNKSNLWALLANKPSDTRSETRIRDPEPTTLDFQALFRKILKTIQDQKHQLVIVVDNLDRLPPEEAITVWATVRALFLGDDGTRSQDDSAATIIMPLDPSALNRLHKAPDGKADTAAIQSFLDKTFDVVFHVPKPVLARRHAYLKERLATVLNGAVNEDELHDIGTVFERQISELDQTPSPRQINSFVNALAVLAMQRRDEKIALTLMTFFVVRRTETADIRKCVATHGAYLATLHDDWRRALAALHFGVPLGLAGELFIDEPLRDAIQRRDDTDFEEFAAMEGFDRLFLHNLDKALQDEAVIQPFSAAVLFQGAIKDHSGSQPWIFDAWSKLRQLAPNHIAGEALQDEDLAGMEVLISTTPKERLAGFLTTLSMALGRSPRTLATSEGVTVFINASHLIEEATKQAGSPPNEKPVPGGFEGASALLMSDLSGDELRDFQFQVADEDAWAGHLAQRLANPAKREGPAVRDLVTALGRRGLDRNWSGLIETLDSVLTTGQVDRVQEVFEIAYALIASSEDARAYFFGRGRLPAYDVAFGGLWHDGRLSGLTAAITFQLFTGSALLISDQTWEQRAERAPELYDDIFEKLRALPVVLDFKWFEERLATFPLDPPLLAELASRVFLGSNPDWPAILSNPRLSLSLFPEAQQPELWSGAMDQPEAQKHITTWDFSVLSQVLNHVALHTPERDLRPWIIHAIHGLPIEYWRDALDRGGDLVALVQSTSWPGPNGEDLGAMAFDALTETAQAVFAPSSLDYRTRWFALEALMAPARRSALRKRLIQSLLRTHLHHNQLYGLLPYLGPSLMQSAYASRDPDAAVQYILAPLAQSPGGRQWLLSYKEQVRAWAFDGDDVHRQQLKLTLRRAAQTGEGAATELLALLRP